MVSSYIAYAPFTVCQTVQGLNFTYTLKYYVAIIVICISCKLTTTLTY